MASPHASWCSARSRRPSRTPAVLQQQHSRSVRTWSPLRSYAAPCISSLFPGPDACMQWSIRGTYYYLWASQEQRNIPQKKMADSAFHSCHLLTTGINRSYVVCFIVHSPLPVLVRLLHLSFSFATCTTPAGVLPRCCLEDRGASEIVHN
jgi:hypothetical protein